MSNALALYVPPRQYWISKDVARRALIAYFAKDELGLTLYNWQLQACEAATPVDERNRHKRIVLCCSRQAGKSLVALVTALHCLFYVPDSLTVIYATREGLSKELLRRAYQLLPAWRQAQCRYNASFLTYGNARILAQPSTENAVIGYTGVNLLIEDEASRVHDVVFGSSTPMVSASGGNILLLSTPKGKRGHFYEVWNGAGPEWLRVSVTADKCPHHSAEFLKQELALKGPSLYAQEYCCEFLDLENAVFLADDIAAAVIEEEAWDL